jgi:hypothetical protein
MACPGTTIADFVGGDAREEGSMKRTVKLSLPTLASVAATRGMLGVGAGLLLAPKMGDKRRRAVGLTLLGIGVASTIPIALRVLGSK